MTQIYQVFWSGTGGKVRKFRRAMAVGAESLSLAGSLLAMGGQAGANTDI
jgi:hypothetical protein